jgi:hypothetical protein
MPDSTRMSMVHTRLNFHNLPWPQRLVSPVPATGHRALAAKHREPAAETPPARGNRLNEQTVHRLRREADSVAGFDGVNDWLLGNMEGRYRLSLWVARTQHRFGLLQLSTTTRPIPLPPDHTSDTTNDQQDLRAMPVSTRSKAKLLDVPYQHTSLPYTVTRRESHRQPPPRRDTSGKQPMLRICPPHLPPKSAGTR